MERALVHSLTAFHRRCQRPSGRHHRDYRTTINVSCSMALSKNTGDGFNRSPSVTSDSSTLTRLAKPTTAVLRMGTVPRSKVRWSSSICSVGSFSVERHRHAALWASGAGRCDVDLKLGGMHAVFSTLPKVPVNRLVPRRGIHPITDSYLSHAPAAMSAKCQKPTFPPVVGSRRFSFQVQPGH